VALGVAVSGLVLWLLVGRPMSTPVAKPVVAWAPLAVAGLGLPLWLPYALEAFAQSRAGVLGSITQGIEHWPVQGAAGVAIVLSSAAMALWHDGRPLLRVAISLSAVYIGMAELAYPDRAGAMGNLVWGWARDCEISDLDGNRERVATPVPARCPLITRIRPVTAPSSRRPCQKLLAMLVNLL
jgi:hypothetical protein